MKFLTWISLYWLVTLSASKQIFNVTTRTTAKSEPSTSPSAKPSDLPSYSPSDTPSDVPSSTPKNTPSNKPSGTSSSKPSDTPSSKPSGTPSNKPSSTPSNKPSSTPSDTPSNTPSDTPSDTPSAGPALIMEDAVKKGLEALDLSGYSGTQSLSTGVVKDSRGVEYSLSGLKPYTGLFSPDSFTISQDGTTAKHKKTKKQFRIPVFRSVYQDNTIVQLVKNDLGNVSFAEIRGPDAQYDTFFVQSDFVLQYLVQENTVGASETLLTFTAANVDETKLGTTFNLGDAQAPLGRDLMQLNVPNDKVPILTHRERRDVASAACQSFRVVSVAVVYDSEFCGVYGSSQATQSRIIAIVASSSLFYEREMCVKLELTDIHTPDKACGGQSSSFASFHKQNVCGGGNTFLTDFTTWIVGRRNAFNINTNAAVHLFTGSAKTSGTIGCSWTGSLCNSKYSYGVEFMTFSSNLLPQAVLFAHELGHNLNAQHVTDSSGKYNYIMEASLSSGSDGFGPVSTGMILSFLNRVTCVHVQSASGTPTAGSPSNRPPTSPSPPSTPSSVIGCRTKAAVQSPSCIVTGSNKYDFACYKLTEILPPYCSFKQLRFVVHTCDGFSLGRRELHRTSSDVAKPVHAVNATVVGGSFSNETGFVQEQSSSSTFQASNCKKSCILSSSSVCFVGSSSHVITFIALDKSGHQVDRVFERTIALNTNSGNSCRSANVKCVN